MFDRLMLVLATEVITKDITLFSKEHTTHEKSSYISDQCTLSQSTKHDKIKYILLLNLLFYFIFMHIYIGGFKELLLKKNKKEKKRKKRILK